MMFNASNANQSFNFILSTLYFHLYTNSKQMKHLTACFGLFLLLISCVEEVDIESARTRKIVVNALLYMEPVQKLSLTYSNALGDYYYDELEEATITLYENGNEAGQYHKTGYSKWELDYTPTAGSQYQLKVEVPGASTIEAYTQMPPNAEVSKAAISNTAYRKHLIQNQAAQPYYIFVMNQEGNEITANPQVEADNTLEMHVGTNHPQVDHFNMQDESMQSLWGSDFSTMEFMAYLRIEADANEESIPFYIEGRLSHCLVFIRTASQEYDRYLKTSLQKMLVYEAFDDDTQWFDENDIYSNIPNGLGIFAAYNDQTIVYNEIEN